MLPEPIAKSDLLPELKNQTAFFSSLYRPSEIDIEHVKRLAALLETAREEIAALRVERRSLKSRINQLQVMRHDIARGRPNAIHSTGVGVNVE